MATQKRPLPSKERGRRSLDRTIDNIFSEDYVQDAFENFPDPGDLPNPVGASVGQVWTADGIGGAGWVDDKIYTSAMIMFNQVSTGAPTYTFLENSAELTISSTSYDSVGNYTVVFEGTPIIDGKTTVFASQNSGIDIHISAMVGGGSYLLLGTLKLNPLSSINSKLLNTAIEIRIYP